MTLSGGEDRRAVPAKVYPAPGDVDEWVVEPPCPGRSSGDLKTFSGSAALPRALEYAHRTYGGALFLSR